MEKRFGDLSRLANRASAAKSLTVEDFNRLFASIDRTSEGGPPSERCKALLHQTDRLCITPTTDYFQAYLDACSLKGKVAKCMRAFNRLRKTGEPPWREACDAMIRCCRIAGDLNTAQKVLVMIVKDAQDGGPAYVQPDADMLAEFLTVGIAARQIDCIAEVLDLAESLEIELDGTSMEKALVFLAKTNGGHVTNISLLQRAMRIYTTMNVRGIRIRDPGTFIRKLANAGFAYDAQKVLEDCTANGIEMPAYAYQYLIGAHLKRGNLGAVLMMYAAMVPSGVIPTAFTFRGLLHNLALRDPTPALFERMKHLCADLHILGVKPDAHVYGIVLSACTARRDHVAAVQQYKEARAVDVQLTKRTYWTLIGMAALQRDFVMMEELIAQADRHQYRLDSTTYQLIVNAYLTALDDIKRAHATVMEMINRGKLSLVACNAFLRQAVRTNHVPLAIHTIFALGKDHRSLNPKVLFIPLPHLVEASHSDAAMRCFRGLLASDRFPTAAVAQRLLTALMAKRRMEDAAELMKEMKRLDIPVWKAEVNTVVTTAIRENDLDRAKSLILANRGTDALEYAKYTSFSDAALKSRRVTD